jgi:hypothetical protein
MKRLMSAMVLLVTIGVMTFVCGQLLAAPVASSQPAQCATSGDPHHHRHHRLSRIAGEVVSVDTTANTITVSSTLKLGPEVVVKKAGETITLSDVKAGDKVMVRYRIKEHKKIVKSIYVFTSAKKKPTPTE